MLIFLDFQRNHYHQQPPLNKYSFELQILNAHSIRSLWEKMDIMVKYECWMMMNKIYFFFYIFFLKIDMQCVVIRRKKIQNDHEIYRKDFYFPFFIQKKTLQTLFIANNIWKQFKLTISILDFSPSCFFSIMISATDIKWIFSFFFLFGMHFFSNRTNIDNSRHESNLC